MSKAVSSRSASLRLAVIRRSLRTRSLLEHAGGEALGQNRPEDGGNDQQRQHRVQHSAIQHALAGGIDRIIANQGGGKRGGDLWQCQGPYRQPCRPAVAEGPADDLRGDPFSNQESQNDSTNERKIGNKAS